MSVWFFLTIWLYNCLIVWLYNCMTVWQYECLVVWLYYCMTVWLYNCRTVWQYDCMFTQRMFLAGWTRQLCFSVQAIFIFVNLILTSPPPWTWCSPWWPSPAWSWGCWWGARCLCCRGPHTRTCGCSSAMEAHPHWGPSAWRRCSRWCESSPRRLLSQHRTWNRGKYSGTDLGLHFKQILDNPAKPLIIQLNPW